MNSRIKTIEDLSLNAWPSHQIQIYDGWLLRFSYFYTHRTNCVEQIGVSTLPLTQKSRTVKKLISSGALPLFLKFPPFFLKALTRCWSRRDMSGNIPPM